MTQKLIQNETSIFFFVDSPYFSIRLGDHNESFSLSDLEHSKERTYIPLSRFDENGELVLFYTSTVLGLYTLQGGVRHGDESLEKALISER